MTVSQNCSSLNQMNRKGWADRQFLIIVLHILGLMFVIVGLSACQSTPTPSPLNLSPQNIPLSNTPSTTAKVGFNIGGWT